MTLLESAALKATTLGASMTDDERAAWGSLDAYEQGELKGWAFAHHEQQLCSEIRGHLRTPAGRAFYRRPEWISPLATLGISTHLPLERRAAPRARGAGRPRAVARASSRSGDSGDDGPGEPEPPGGRLPNDDVDRRVGGGRQ